MQITTWDHIQIHFMVRKICKTEFKILRSLGNFGQGRQNMWNLQVKCNISNMWRSVEMQDITNFRVIEVWNESDDYFLCVEGKHMQYVLNAMYIAYNEIIIPNLTLTNPFSLAWGSFRDFVEKYTLFITQSVAINIPSQTPCLLCVDQLECVFNEMIMTPFLSTLFGLLLVGRCL